MFQMFQTNFDKPSSISYLNKMVSIQHFPVRVAGCLRFFILPMITHCRGGSRAQPPVGIGGSGLACRSLAPKTVQFRSPKPIVTPIRTHRPTAKQRPKPVHPQVDL